MARSEVDKRKAKLTELLDKLERREAVHNRELRTWLGEAAYADYKYVCRVQQELRDELKNKPSEVKEYERRLRLALLAYNKGEGASSRGRHAAAKRYFAEADTLFERALEWLEGIIHVDASLCVWFDRDTNWTADSEIALAPSAVPRVVTSRSLDNRGGGITRRLQTKRELKIAAIERALFEAEGDAEQVGTGVSAAQKAQLEAFLRLRDEDEF